MSTFPCEPICRSLKYRIEASAIADEEISETDKKFFPKSQLRRRLNKETIYEVLKCRCDSCTSRRDDHNLDLDAAAQQIASQNSVLFALLLYIECPQLITIFLRKAYDDAQLENDQGIPPDYVRRQLWPCYNARYPDDSKRLAKAFAEHTFKFVVPPFTDEPYSVYGPSNRLPFINEKPLGRRTDDGIIQQEGVSGNVYAFRVSDEYRNLTVSSFCDLMRPC